MWSAILLKHSARKQALNYKHLDVMNFELSKTKSYII